MKLDLGCGRRKEEGFVGIDISSDSDADIVWDLRKAPWLVGEEVEIQYAVGMTAVPHRARRVLEDESVDEIYCSHFFEHLTGPERMPFMNEVWRVLKVGATAKIIVPFYSSTRAIQDPTHAWPPVCEESFLYFNKNWREMNKLGHYPIRADFDFTCGYVCGEDIAVRAKAFQEFAIKHYLNTCMDLQIVLTRRPDARPE